MKTKSISLIVLSVVAGVFLIPDVSSASNAGKVLVGGVGSSHKGGHYVDPSGPVYSPTPVYSSPATTSAPTYSAPAVTAPPATRAPSTVAPAQQPVVSMAPAFVVSRGGAVTGGTKEQICRRGYASSVRKVSAPMKARIYAAFGITNRSGYVIDHIVPLAVGGSNEAANLQPQRISESKKKDALEVGTRAALCSGKITLAQAQGRFMGGSSPAASAPAVAGPVAPVGTPVPTQTTLLASPTTVLSAPVTAAPTTTTTTPIIAATTTVFTAPQPLPTVATVPSPVSTIPMPVFLTATAIYQCPGQPTAQQTIAVPGVVVIPGTGYCKASFMLSTGVKALVNGATPPSPFYAPAGVALSVTDGPSIVIVYVPTPVTTTMPVTTTTTILPVSTCYVVTAITSSTVGVYAAGDRVCSINGIVVDVCPAARMAAGLCRLV